MALGRPSGRGKGTARSYSTIRSDHTSPFRLCPFFVNGERDHPESFSMHVCAVSKLFRSVHTRRGVGAFSVSKLICFTRPMRRVGSENIIAK